MTLVELLSSYGYSVDGINKILRDPTLAKYNKDDLKNKIISIFGYLVSIYDNGDAIKITLKYPTIYSLSVLNLESKLDYLIGLGYDIRIVQKILKELPKIYGLSSDSINEKIEDMMKLGYMRDDVLRMVKVYPTLLNYDIDTIKQKISEIVRLGYSYNDVIEMVRVSPALCGLSSKKFSVRMKGMIDLGYDKDDVISMTTQSPSLLSFSTENLGQKVSFYDSIGLHDVMISDPMRLVQSVKLTSARYRFLLSKGVIVDVGNYRALFASRSRFEQRYRITTENLLNEYGGASFDGRMR